MHSLGKGLKSSCGEFPVAHHDSCKVHKAQTLGSERKQPAGQLPGTEQQTRAQNGHRRTRSAASSATALTRLVPLTWRPATPTRPFVCSSETNLQEAQWPPTPERHQVSPDKGRKQAPTIQNNTAACPPVSVPVSDKGLPPAPPPTPPTPGATHRALPPQCAPPQCGPCHPAPTLQMTV